MRIGFLVTNAAEVSQVAEIMRHFEEPDVIFTDQCSSALVGFDPQWLTKYGAYSRFIRETELDQLDGEYDAVISVISKVLPLKAPWIQTSLVVCQHSEVAEKSDRWKTAELGLVYGKHSDRIVGTMCPTSQIGNPRFDPFFERRLDPFVLKTLRSRLDPAKQNVAFLSDLNSHASCAAFTDALKNLLPYYNVIFSSHHAKSTHCVALHGAEGELLDMSSVASVLDAKPFLMELADVVVSNRRSEFLDALYCQKPAIMLCAGGGTTRHNETYFSGSDLNRNKLGPTISDASQLLSKVRELTQSPSRFQAANESHVMEYFVQRGDCSVLAAQAIYALKCRETRRQSGSSAECTELHRAAYAVASSRLLRRRGTISKRVLKSVYNYIRVFAAKKNADDSSNIRRALIKGNFFSAGRGIERWAKREPNEAMWHLYRFYQIASNLRFSRRQFRTQLKRLHGYASDAREPVAARRNVLHDLGRISEAKLFGAELSDTRQMGLEHASALLGGLEEQLERAVHNESVGIEQQIALSPSGQWISLKEASGKVFEVSSVLGFARSVSEEMEGNRKAMLSVTSHAIDALREDGWTILPRLQAGHLGAVPITGRYPSLTWHTTHAGVPGQLHLKVGALADHIIIDSRGYSGWASLGQMSFPEIVQGVTEQQAEDQVSFLRKAIIERQNSKYRQNTEAISVTRPYIFFPMQLVDDAVSRLAYIEGLELLRHLVEWGKTSDHTIVVKRHPRCRNSQIEAALHRYLAEACIVRSDASIHNLIMDADCVVTVNSGVGAEALLHLKPVITTGACDYSAATLVARTGEELARALERVPFHPVPQDQLKKFLWYYTKRFQVRGDDVHAIHARVRELVLQ